MLKTNLPGSHFQALKRTKIIQNELITRILHITETCLRFSENRSRYSLVYFANRIKGMLYKWQKGIIQ